EITHGRNYVIGTRIGAGETRADVTPPVVQWTPSIAPSGLAVYRGDAFPRWHGNLFAGSLKFALLVRLVLDDAGRVVHEERLLEDRLGRIRDVRVGPDGYLYLLTDSADGIIARLVPPDS
ncbi:MAG: PQQ-dependent sugar dehydrogenase, partial [Gammaproteobacteria bacterium]